MHAIKDMTVISKKGSRRGVREQQTELLLHMTSAGYLENPVKSLIMLSTSKVCNKCMSRVGQFVNFELCQVQLR